MNPRSNEPTPGAHWTEHLALDLVQGLLATEAEAAALEHAGRCPGCEQMLERAVRDRETGRIAQHRAARRAAGTRPRAMAAAEIVPLRRRAGSRRGRTAALVAAAAAAIALALAGPWRTLGPRAEWLPAQGVDLRLRGAFDAPETGRLERGLQTYAAHDIRGTIAALEGLQLSGSLEHVRRLYLGSALVHARRYRDAVAILETLPDDGLPEPWGDEGRWAFFVALDKSGDRVRAGEVLRRLAGEPTAAGERARAWRAKHGEGSR